MITKKTMGGTVLGLTAAAMLFASGCGSDNPSSAKACGGPGIICTVVGQAGIAGFNPGDNAPEDALLYWPQDVAFGPNGDLFVLDFNNHRVRECNFGTDKITTVIGSGVLGDGLDRPALQINLNHPTGVTWDSQGRLILAAWHNWKVKRLDDDGVVRSIAGTSQGFLGDGGPATAAKLDLPSSVLYDSQGNLYISDQGNGRIRKVDTNGMITTFAGIGGLGFGGDGGPATAAQFNFPKGSDAGPGGRIAIGPDKDEIYVADTYNNRIRVIDLGTGVINTFAGTGAEGYSGDGGPAANAEFFNPTDVAVGDDHSVYVCDSKNNVVRKIDPLGIVTTVAGTGTAGYSGDGGPATEAELNLTPSELTDTRAGGGIAVKGNILYIADTYNEVIRRVELP